MIFNRCSQMQRIFNRPMTSPCAFQCDSFDCDQRNYYMLTHNRQIFWMVLSEVCCGLKWQSSANDDIVMNPSSTCDCWVADIWRVGIFACPITLPQPSKGGLSENEPLIASQRAWADLLRDWRDDRYAQYWCSTGIKSLCGVCLTTELLHSVQCFN